MFQEVVNGPALSLILKLVLFDGEGDKQTNREMIRKREEKEKEGKKERKEKQKDVSLKPPSRQGKMLR